MKRRMVYVLGFVGFLVVLTTAWAMTSRVGYESADYQLIESDGNIEIRKYPVLVLAATTSDLDSQAKNCDDHAGLHGKRPEYDRCFHGIRHAR